MREQIFKFIVLPVLLYVKCYSADVNPPAAQEAKKLSYTIIDDEDKSKKLKLTLSGIDYGNNQHCLIKKGKSDLSAYEEINTCPDSDGTSGQGKCVIPCNSATNKLTYKILSPRNKYIYVFAADSAATAASNTKGGNVFGFEMPLLVNPQVAISTNAQKLKFSVITCDNVNCPVKYKKVEYHSGTAGADCVAASIAEVEFDLMIPYYEMQCEKYPSFFYQMPNAYMKKEIDVFKPQYYVAFESDNKKTEYYIKFSNNFPTEICRFGIRDAAGTTKGTYSHICGATGKECYAPCDNVRLTLAPSKVLVDISIQTRHHDIKATEEKYEGYKQKKFVIIEPEGGLLKDLRSTGVTLNASPFKPTDSNIFTTCHIKHFPADKPRPTARSGTAATCDTSPCQTECNTSLSIQNIGEGKPTMIEIASANTDDQTGFNEYLFVRTSPKTNAVFITTNPTVTESTAVIKALEGAEETTTEQPTCTYYISMAGKNAFIDAHCSDSFPCRGHCKESKTIINLIPGSTYDIKVVAHKEYATKTYSGVKTNLATLTLTSSFLDKGFKVVGTLSTPDPDAECEFKLQRNDEIFKEVLVCPPPTSIPKTKAVSKILKGEININVDVKDSTSPVQKLALPSTSNELKIARAGTPTSDPTTPSTQSTNINVRFPPCTQAPLCNSIVVGVGYEADKEYKLLVTAIGRSEEVSISIPKNPSLVSNEDMNKNIDIVIVRDDKTLQVKTILPQGTDENSLCKWELIEWDNVAKPIAKKCMVVGRDCTVFPSCRDISISDVEDNSDYRLRVIHSIDKTIFGTAIIKRGETSNKSTSRNTIIISVVVPVVIVIIGAGFCFGYMKNKN